MQNQALIVTLEFGVAVLFWLVFVVIETAVLQFVNWGDFRRCLKASLYANLASALIVAISLIWMPRLGFVGVGLGTLIAIGVEGIIFMRLKPGAKRQNWLAAFAANLITFAILVFPVYWITRSMF